MLNASLALRRASLQLSSRFHEAVTYALDAHAPQYRRDTAVPYASHLLGVAALVLEAGGDEDQAIAALLHDVVEDQGGAEQLVRVRERFGERVATIVDACSDSDVMPKPPWWERKTAYLDHLPEADADALIVSWADKLHNARSILTAHRDVDDLVWRRFRGGARGTAWYYTRIVAALRSTTLPVALVDELDDVVTELCRRAGFTRDDAAATRREDVDGR